MKAVAAEQYIEAHGAQVSCAQVYAAIDPTTSRALARPPTVLLNEWIERWLTLKVDVAALCGTPRASRRPAIAATVSRMSSDVSAKRAALLAELSSSRQRTSDEHMFRLPSGARWRVTFRLQLFTASGARPVAVATQMTGAGDGASLTNAAEHCAAEVWRRYFPDAPQPPIWIQHMIMGERRHLRLVSFTPGAVEHTLRNPRWTSVTPADVDMLVGQTVDLERGDGFMPALPEPEPQPVYAAAMVALLPRPQPFREQGCMAAGVPWWRRLGRQLVPRRGGRDCCWYHGGDWHTVSRLAVRLAGQARAAGISFDDTAYYVRDHPDAQALTDWERDAFLSLFEDTIRPDARWPSSQGYNNGQHRAQALIDAGVRRTLTERTAE